MGLPNLDARIDSAEGTRGVGLGLTGLGGIFRQLP